MGKCRLTYFNARGLTEVSRIILKLSGQDFEDVRVERDEWLKMKKDTPQGKLPVLEDDGRIICQSSAIYRYLARKYGLFGDDDNDYTAIDIVIGTIDDIWPPMIKMFYGENDEIKATAKTKMEDDVIPYVMGYLTKILKANTSGYLVGKRLTLADLLFFTASEQVCMAFPDFLEKYPELKSHRKTIEEIPEITKWVQERPVTQH